MPLFLTQRFQILFHFKYIEVYLSISDNFNGQHRRQLAIALGAIVPHHRSLSSFNYDLQSFINVMMFQIRKNPSWKIQIFLLSFNNDQPLSFKHIVENYVFQNRRQWEDRNWSQYTKCRFSKPLAELFKMLFIVLLQQCSKAEYIVIDYRVIWNRQFFHKLNFAIKCTTTIWSIKSKLGSIVTKPMRTKSFKTKPFIFIIHFVHLI